MLVGTKDFLLEHNRRIHTLLGELGIAHEYEEVEGLAHDLRGLARERGSKTLEFAAARW